MPATKKKAAGKGSKTATKPLTPKELKEKVEILTDLTERLKLENEEMKIKYRLLCEKIVSNVDLSNYTNIDPKIEPERIDLGDIMHMVQKVFILATELKASERVDSHLNGFEFRLNEITDVESPIFRDKLKLKNRMEFIKQERDVWKRNSENYKQMYIKIFKAHENPPLPILGVHKADQPETVAQVTTVTSVKSPCCKNCKPTIIQHQTEVVDDNNNKKGEFESDSGFLKTFDEITLENTQNNLNNNQENSDNQLMIRNRRKFEGIPNLKRFEIESSNIEIIDRPTISRKNVSFNKDIDVGIFRKDAKNLKLIESYLQPLPIQVENKNLKDDNKTCEQSTNGIQKADNTYQANSIDVHNQIRNLLNSRNSFNSNSLFSIVNRRTSSPMSSASSESKYTNRASICSNRKFPGETPVKDLEPTLKMIIIKELSMEKLDGNDWRMFAKRIGISDSEIKEWELLKLQYPMARVLSFWSSRPEATTRLLHRHLNASCFHYMVLAKRIENFYDVV